MNIKVHASLEQYNFFKDLKYFEATKTPGVKAMSRDYDLFEKFGLSVSSPSI